MVEVLVCCLANLCGVSPVFSFFPVLGRVFPVVVCYLFWVVVLMLGCDYWVVGSGCL
jgi:hypothetical protein